MDVSGVQFKPRVNPDAKVTRYRKGQVCRAPTAEGPGAGLAVGRTYLQPSTLLACVARSPVKLMRTEK
jgi:hypothetical protein